jgi:serine/threonine-protein kinase
MVAERYEIDDVIGSGGMSVVYRAHDKKLDRYITLKVLKEEYLSDENLIERFPKEARAAAALNHNNIVSIFDHGRDGDILYIVLEYVDGASLKELINRKAPFDDETNLGVAIQVAEGLSEAHRNSIIHLDIKPQNILVTTTSIVKVTDFGIARVAKSVTLNAAAGSMGSVHYFSPEQARGGYIDHKSDIYSMGIVMFEMATGQLPFEGENEVSIALQHINDPLPDILKLNPNVSDSVIKIIGKATEKSASKRYQTVDDMIDDLKRALTDASGAFVAVESHDESPTRTISEENKEAVRRQKMRQAFLDGVDMPEEEVETFKLHSAKPIKNASYDDSEYEDYTEYADDEYYENYREPASPRDNKADKAAVYGGVILGIILAIGFGFLTIHFYNRYISDDNRTIETPNVVGMNWDAAELVTRNLRLMPVRDEDDQYCENEDCEFCEINDCAGRVLMQRTDPGIMLSPGDILHIVISLGARGDGVLMPRLERRTYEDAMEILSALDIELNIQRTDHEDESVPRDYIIAQFPEPNELLNDGGSVLLTVSLGPDGSLVSVPLLIGTREAVALETLRTNFLTGATERQENEFFPEGQVIRQEPGPGEMVERHTVVTLYISTGAAPLPTPDSDATPSPETSPTPSPIVTPTPEVTPAPEVPPVVTPEPPAETPTPTTAPTEPAPIITGTITIHLWNVPEGTETVHLVLQRQIGNNDPTYLINDENVPVSRFPITKEVEYSDPTVFRVFSVENGVFILRSTEPKP